MMKALDIVVLGLSLSSSWGNGHAVTYRALLKALAQRGHRILFLEREKPWYAVHRDLNNPAYCRLEFYKDFEDLKRFSDRVGNADLVMVGSYVPEGRRVGEWAQRTAGGIVAFYDIDTPVTLANLAVGKADYLSSNQISDYDIYFTFTGGPTLDLLRDQHGAPIAAPLYCSADLDLYRPVSSPKRWDLSYLGTFSADRQPALERLLLETARRLPGRKFAVAGAQYPGDIDWPANVQVVAHLPPSEHPSFYAASRFALNITRARMMATGWSPSIRLFEAAACATPVISDAWDGLSEFFEPGLELLTVATSEDVVAALEMPVERARSIGEAARRRLLAAHTPSHRAETLERSVASAISKRAPRVTRIGEIGGSAPAGPKRILVAGGAGFLGSHLCDRLLSAGHEVVCLDSLLTGNVSNLEQALGRPSFEFVKASIVNPLPLRLSQKKFDRIYNLACAASPPQYQADPEHTLMTSVVGAQRLLQLAELCGARFLLASTSEIYGDPEVHPQPESYRGCVNPTGPRACYDEGKRAAETLTFDYHRMGRADVRVARIFNTYGPRLSPADGRVVSNLVRQALCGEDITVFGDGSQTRSFCYVDDLVSGLVALMEYEGAQPGPVNLGNPAEMSVKELTDLIVTMTRSQSKLVYRPLPEDDPRRRQPDVTKAREVLGWRPNTPIEIGLRRTIDWFEEGRRDASLGSANRVSRETAGSEA